MKSVWTHSLAVFCAGFSCVAAPPPQVEAVQPTGVPDRKARHRNPPRATLVEEATATPTVSGAVPTTRAASVIVIDAQLGRNFSRKKCRRRAPAASTQKLLTALIVAERGFLDHAVTVQPVDTLAEPVKLNIKPGDTYQRIDLLRALLVKSPNDVARCLARDSAGSVEAFAEVMNEKARQLGATNSHFLNPNGLPIPGQYSTARDLSIIAAPPMRIPRFARSSACER